MCHKMSHSYTLNHDKKHFWKKSRPHKLLRNVHVAISVPQNKEENGSKMADYSETVGSNNETNSLARNLGHTPWVINKASGEARKHSTAHSYQRVVH